MHRPLNHRYVARPRGGRKASPVNRPQRARLNVEMLEDRLAPAVLNVNSLADILSPAPGVVTLRSAIQKANQTPGGNTINLNVAGTYTITLLGANEDANATGDFDILASGGNLNIVNTSGGRVTIDGGGLDRVFDINPTFDPNKPAAPFKVTLQGLTIQHGIAVLFGGNTIEGGGAIQDTGNASLELDNCVVSNNAATGAGGGILMQNAVNTPWTLTVNNCVISNNHAGDAGGGIDTLGSGKVFVSNSQLVENTCVNQGAAIWLDTIDNASATLALTNTLVSRNDAFAGPTGALGAAGNGSVTITGSTVSDNYSGSTGGGFGDENKLANVTITNSQFLNNVAMTDGGGVQAGGSGTTVTISGSVFAGNTAGGNGGGFLASGGKATITNTRFTENSAMNGGGIDDQAATLSVSFSEFDHNRAVAFGGTGGQGGGAIFAGDGVSSVTVANCLFLNNAAADAFNYNGGAILQAVGALSVTASQFTGNGASLHGGAIYFAGLGLTVSGSTFNGNHADAGNGGGLLMASLDSGSSATLTNDTFSGNAAPRNSGGGVAVTTGGSVTFLNDTITGNTAFTAGGVFVQIVNSKSTFALQNTIVALNSAPNNPDISIFEGTFADRGGNFIGKLGNVTGFSPGTLTGDPKLGLLQNNGGPFAGLSGQGQVLLTEAPLTGSPLIGGGVKSGAPGADERGLPRPTGNPSIGAFQPQNGPDDTPNERLVDNLFEVLLGRLADAGADLFARELDHGVSPATVVLQIEGSSEYLGNQVQQLYQHYLHRQADSGALQVFVNLLSHGGTLEQVAALLVGSDEYFQLHGGNNVSFLTALYLDALGRTPDPFGLDSFTQLLAGGATRTAVAAAVFASAEYQSNLVCQSYVTFLGRPADSSGQSYFAGALQNGLTDQTLVSILLGSSEALANRM